jgi:hypothetical protein
VPNQILLVHSKQGGQWHVGLKRKEMRIVPFWKYEGKIPWCRLEDNIKKDLKKNKRELNDLDYEAQDRDKWQAYVNMVNNLQVS